MRVSAETNTPAIITYQGKLLENDTSVTTTKSMSFVLYTELTGGDAVYTAAGVTSTPTSTAVSVTPSRGVFSIDLGGGGTNALPRTIFQENEALYLEVWVGGQALTPRKQLTSAPYAFNSQYLLGLTTTSTASETTYIPHTNSSGQLNLLGLGINSSSPQYGLAVSGTSYISATSTYGGLLDINNRIDLDYTVSDYSAQSFYNNASMVLFVNNAGSSSVTHRGLSVQALQQDDNNLTHSTHGLLGGGFEAYNNGAGTVSNAVGAIGGVINGSTGTITKAFGYGAYAYNTGGGTLTDYVAFGAWQNISATNSYLLGTDSGASSVLTGSSINFLNVSTPNYIPLSVSSTGITFATSTLRLATQSSGDVELQAATSANVYINPDGVDADFRVSGGSETNLIYVDAGNNRVGIGTSTPDSFFHVTGTSTFDSLVNVRGNAVQPKYVGAFVSSTVLNNGGHFDFYKDYIVIPDDQSNGLTILSVATSTVPIFVSYTNDGDQGAQLNNPIAAVVQGDLAYVISRTDDAINVFDISNPASPVLLSTLTDSTNLNNVISLDVQGSYIYTAATLSNQISVIDASDPYNLRIVGSINSSAAASLAYVTKIETHGKYAHVLSNIYDTYTIIDIADPTQPRYVSSISTSTISNMGGTDIEVVGELAYVIDDDSLIIIDISNPQNPSLVGSIDDGDGNLVLDNAFSFRLIGDYAYIASQTSANLSVIDVSDPTNPTHVGTLNDGDNGAQLTNASYINIMDNAAYIISTGANDRITAIDITGSRISNARIGGARVDELSVMKEANFARTLDVKGGLNVGSHVQFGGGVLSLFSPTSTAAATTTFFTNATTLFETSVSSTDPSMFIFNTRYDADDASELFVVQDAGNDVFTILGNGKVGIGTSTPTGFVDINSGSSVGSDNVLILRSDVAGANDPIFRVSATGTIFSDGPHYTAGADYAEYFYTVDTDLTPGEIVCVDTAKENAVRRCIAGTDGNVMGIVSSKPSLVGNYSEDRSKSNSWVVIGMLGQVDARVSAENGPIRVGDSLTSASSTPGYAMRADAGDPTVGVALEAIDTGKGTVRVLISRRNKSLTVTEVEQQVVERVAAMEIEDEVRIMIGAALDDLDLNTDIAAVVDEQIQDMNLYQVIRATVDQHIEDKRIPEMIEETVGTIDIVSRIADQEINIKEALHFAETVDAVVSSTFLQQQSTLDELTGLAQATDVMLSDLLTKQQTIDERLLDAESKMSVLEDLHGHIGEKLQGGAETLLGQQVDYLEVSEDLVVYGEITVYKTVTFGGNTVGQATILSGHTSVSITFSDEYQFHPIIVATLRGEIDTPLPSAFYVVDETTEGFLIRIPDPLEADISFNWHAFGAQNAKLFVSDGSTKDIVVIVADTPSPEIPAIQEPSKEESITSSENNIEETVDDVHSSSTNDIAVDENLSTTNDGEQQTPQNDEIFVDEAKNADTENTNSLNDEGPTDASTDTTEDIEAPSDTSPSPEEMTDNAIASESDSGNETAQTEQNNEPAVPAATTQEESVVAEGNTTTEEG